MKTVKTYDENKKEHLIAVQDKYIDIDGKETCDYISYDEKTGNVTSAVKAKEGKIVEFLKDGKKVPLTAGNKEKAKVNMSAIESVIDVNFYLISKDFSQQALSHNSGSNSL